MNPSQAWQRGAPSEDVLLAARRRAILCVGARAGDEVLYGGAALRRFAAEGARVVVVALAPRVSALPGIGTLVPRVGSVAGMLAQSAKVLGAARVELLDMSLPPLGSAERIALQLRLAAIIRDERPDIVLSHGPGLGEVAVDRRAAAGLVDAAIAAAGVDLLKGGGVKLPAKRHEVSERWFFASGQAALWWLRRSRRAIEGPAEWRCESVAVDASEAVLPKWRALSAYLLDPPPEPPSALRPLLATERFVRAIRVAPLALARRALLSRN